MEALVHTVEATDSEEWLSPRQMGGADDAGSETKYAEGPANVVSEEGLVFEMTLDLSPPAIDVKDYSSTTLEPMHQYAGEVFHLVREEDHIMLTHDRFPISGAGATLISAEEDLLDRARAIAPAYIGRPISKMTLAAFDFRSFLLRII